MALALLGYFGTMMAGLVVLMTLLNGVLSSYPMQKTKPHPYPLPAMAQPVAAANSDTNNPSGRWPAPVIHRPADDTTHPLAANTNAMAAAGAPSVAAKQPAAGTAGQLKQQSRQARDQKRRDEVARAAEDRTTSAALGYDQERSRQTLGPLASNPFGLFEPRRF